MPSMRMLGSSWKAFTLRILFLMVSATRALTRLSSGNVKGRSQIALPNQYSTGEFADCCDQHGLPHRERAGRDGSRE